MCQMAWTPVHAAALRASQLADRVVAVRLAVARAAVALVVRVSVAVVQVQVDADVTKRAALTVAAAIPVVVNVRHPLACRTVIRIVRQRSRPITRPAAAVSRRTAHQSVTQVLDVHVMLAARRAAGSLVAAAIAVRVAVAHAVAVEAVGDRSADVNRYSAEMKKP